MVQKLLKTDSQTEINHPIKASFKYAIESLIEKFEGEFSRLPQREKIIAISTCKVIAPMWIAYCLWVVHQCKERGIKRIYCMSRDGQIYYKVLTILKERLNFDIELRYFYTSRRVWTNRKMPTEKAEMSKLLTVNRVRPLRVFLRMYYIPNDLFTNTYYDLFQESIDLETLLMDHNFENLLAAFQSEPIIEAHVKNEKQRTHLAHDYLKQEGFMDDTKWAIVDVGWQGSAQNAISRFLKPYNIFPIGFWFDIRQEGHIPEYGLKLGYISDLTHNTGYKLLFGNIQAMIESFCYATHASVSGLKEIDGKIHPIYEPENKHALAWGIEVLHQWVEKCTREIDLSFWSLEEYVDIRPELVNRIEVFARRPKKQYAKVWGEIRVPMNSGEMKLLAQPYTLRHIVKAFRFGTPFHHNRSWLEGSLALSNPIIAKAVLWAAAAGRKTKKQLGRRALFNDYAVSLDNPVRRLNKLEDGDDSHLTWYKDYLKLKTNITD